MSSPGKPHGRRPAMSRAKGRLIVNAATSTTSLTNPAATVTEPVTQVVPMEDYPILRIVFGGTNVDDTTVNYQIIGWYKMPLKDAGVSDVWTPHLLAKGAYTLGQTTIPGVTNGFFADTITETIGAAGTIIIPQTPDESVAEMIVDARNCTKVSIETDLGDALTAYVWAVPGEMSAGMTDIDVTGTGLATAARQDTGNDSLSVLDDWDETNRAKVNLIAGQAGVAGNAGNAGATVPRVVIATDDINMAAIAADTAELTSAPVAKVPVAIVKALAGTPIPLALAASETYVTSFYVQAARADGDNSGNVFLGLIADLVSGTKNYYKLTPGATYEYKCRAGTKANLALWGIDGETAADGVIGLHEPV